MESDTPEWVIPIVGHPSAGKSTLIRYLTGVKVPIGKKSGTTKKIKEFALSNHLFIRDYPGFGRIEGRSKEISNRVQQKIIDDIDDLKDRILVGIIVADLSNVALMASKFDKKGFVPIDFEMVEFLIECSKRNQPMVLGNKIDKLPKNINPDEFLDYFPPKIDFFPVALKNKIGLEPVLYHLQNLVDEVLGDELYERWWRL